MDVEKTSKRDFAALFSKSNEKMLNTSNTSDSSSRYTPWCDIYSKFKFYDKSTIADIIENGSLDQKRKLSRYYFNRNGYYRQILIYYSTLLKYDGILIPNCQNGANLSNQTVYKKYLDALEYVNNLNLPISCSNFALRALIDGTYYGVRTDNQDKTKISILDLPAQKCRSRFKDTNGNDIIEFDLTYFQSITDPVAREAALSAFPEFVIKAYNKFSKGKLKSNWIIIPTDIGVCFPFLDEQPLFLSLIPKTIEYEEAVKLNNDKVAESIKRIIVQKIQHLADGRLVFEPEEAEEMHNGAVSMLSGEKNVSVLTTYADVDSINPANNTNTQDDYINRAEQDIYAQAGVSGQIFASSTTTGLKASLNKDLSLMMYLANKFSNFITNAINKVFGNKKLSFKYKILPTTYHNTDDYINTTLKLSNNGYSFLIPSIAAGINQIDLINIKTLENEILKLNEKLIPLQTSYTQSGEVTAKDSEGGRPQSKEEDKTEQTIIRQTEIDKDGGVNGN